MHEFTPFKKIDKLSYESFVKFSRELLEREEYKSLSPTAMLLYSILTDRLELSFKQIDGNKKIQFYDGKGEMYVIFKREEMREKLHVKRTTLDTALTQLKQCNLVLEKQQGRNKPNKIYLGKTIGMIENEAIEKIRSAENQQLGMQENNIPECRKTAVHNSNNNINIINNNKGVKDKNKYLGRTYPPGFLEQLYVNNDFKNEDIKDYEE